jgi:hypothetical protein
VFYHDTKSDNNNQGEEEAPYDIDYSASSIQAFTKLFCTRPQMRSNTPLFAEMWHVLDDKSKATLDLLDETAKSIILGYVNDHQSSLNPSVSFNGSSSPNRLTLYRPPIQTQANLHENMHDVHVNPDEYHECHQEMQWEDVAEMRTIHASLVQQDCLLK